MTGIHIEALLLIIDAIVVSSAMAAACCDSILTLDLEFLNSVLPEKLGRILSLVVCM